MAHPPSPTEKFDFYWLQGGSIDTIGASHEYALKVVVYEDKSAFLQLVISVTD